jgi:hypothetical protein
MFKIKSPAQAETRPSDATLLSFDLPDLIKRMKHSPSWAKGDLNAMILMKNPERQIVLAALHGGTEINSLQSADSVTVQVVEGALTFRTRKEAAILDTGQLMALYEKINYSLSTNEDTVILLTISNGT